MSAGVATLNNLLLYFWLPSLRKKVEGTFDYTIVSKHRLCIYVINHCYIPFFRGKMDCFNGTYILVHQNSHTSNDCTSSLHARQACKIGLAGQFQFTALKMVVHMQRCSEICRSCLSMTSLSRPLFLLYLLNYKDTLTLVLHWHLQPLWWCSVMSTSTIQYLLQHWMPCRKDFLVLLTLL